MRPTGDLRSLQRSALLRVSRLRAYAGSGLNAMGTKDAKWIDPTIAFVVIELDNLWVGFARSFFLSVAFCARDASGRRVYLSKVPRARHRDEALTHAIRRCRGPRYRAGSTGPWLRFDEPLWWKPGTLLEALDEIGASNYRQVSSAISVAPGAFMYLHTFRNFYAHRSREARIEVMGGVRRLQYPTSYTATMALMSATLTMGSVRPQALLLDWFG